LGSYSGVYYMDYMQVPRDHGFRQIEVNQ
jgi:hypothetical protein